MPEQNVGQIESDFRKMANNRSSKRDTAEESSSLTLPNVLPPQGFTNDQELSNPYNSIGSQGVTSISSQLAFALIPPNGIPFFEWQPDFPGDAPAGEVQAIKRNLARAEKRVMNRLLASNLREGLLDLMVQLTVVGDSLFIFEEDFRFRTIRFDHWVVDRFATGRWDRVIYREAIRADKAPESWNVENTISKGINDPATSNPLIEWAYTEVIKTQEKEGDKVTFAVKTEFRGTTVAEDTITKGEKFLVLQWKSLPGENYGQSFVDEAKGDLRTVEGLTQSLVEGAAANSEHRWFVKPGGVTQITDIKRSINGDFIPGRKEDVEALQLDNVVQLQITLQALEGVKRDLARKFLLQSELQPTGDRVTATQIRALAQSLEDASGGIFSTISRALQIPLVTRTVALMADQGITQLMNNELVTLNVKTGLETLSREIEHQRVLQLSQALIALPDDWRIKIKKDPALASIVRAFGQDPNEWIETDEAVAEQVSASQDNAIQQQGQQQAIQSAGAIAEQDAATE